MSRIFNLLIEHQGQSFPALLTMSGDAQENAAVRVISNEHKIEIILPNGTLSFSTAEVVKHLMNGSAVDGNSIMKITPAITLQLLKENW